MVTASETLSRYSFKVGDVLLNHYEVMSVLAENKGMANVYIVKDLTMPSIRMVVKQVMNYHIYDQFMPPETEVRAHKAFLKKQAQRQLEYQASMNEANVMSVLAHQGIPRIARNIKDPDGNYSIIVMDYIPGKTVSEMIQYPEKDRNGNIVMEPERLVPRLDANGKPINGLNNKPQMDRVAPSPKMVVKPIPQDRAISWVSMACSILMYLHNPQGDRGPIAYRDMKPANLRVTQEGRIVLLDYGIAKVIEYQGQKSEQAVGTRGFAPPEQTKSNSEYDTRHDLYALGVTLYNMLTGVSPVAKDNKGVPYHKNGTPFSPREMDPGINKGLDGLVRKATAVDIKDRFQTAEEMMDALQNIHRYDKSRRKKDKRKVKIVTSMLVGSGLLAVGSLIPFGLNQQEQGQKYNNALSVASQTGRFEDYISAISMEPSKIGPYNNMLNSVKTDGKFTSEEEKELLGIINPNIDSIKEQAGYGDLAYEIGRLYWFYYAPDGKPSQEGMSLSTKWFQDAIDGGSSDKNLAQVYYNLGEFDKTISSAIQESNDSGKYKEYWNNLIKAQTAENGEVVNLQIYNALATCIDNYSNRLQTDGVPKQEVLQEIQKLEAYVKNNNPSAGVPETLYSSLKDKLPGLRDKLELAYKGH